MLSIKDFFKKKPIYCLLLLILVTSFVAKLIVGYTIRESFFHRGNSYDSLNAIAFNLANHCEYAIETGIPSIDYEPLYPFILAFCYKIFGANWFGVTVIQAMLFGITSYLLFLIGKKIKNELAGLIAAAYYSFYPYLFLNSLSVVDTTQFIFVTICLVYVVLYSKERGYPFWSYGCMGSLMGLTFLSRGSALAFLPPILLYIFLTTGNKRIIIKSIILFISAFLTLSPWLTRNYLHTGTLVISTHGSFGLWQGNNEYSYGYLKNNISLDEIYRRKPPPPIYQNNPIRPRPPVEAIKVAQEYKSEAVRFIKDNPKEFSRLCWIKFVKFWSLTYNPVVSSYAYGSNTIRQHVYFVTYAPLLFTVFLGLYFLERKSLSLFLMFLGIMVTYTAAHMIVMGFTRTRLPLDPLLMVLFGITISTIYVKIRSTSNFSS